MFPLLALLCLPIMCVFTHLFIFKAVIHPIRSWNDVKHGVKSTTIFFKSSKNKTKKYLHKCAPCCSVHLCVGILTVIVLPIICMIAKYAISDVTVGLFGDINKYMSFNEVSREELSRTICGFRQYFTGSFELQSLKSSIIESELTMHQRFVNILQKRIFVHRAIEHDIIREIHYLWSEGGVVALGFIGDSSIGKTTSITYALLHHNVVFKLYAARFKRLAILLNWMIWIMSAGYLSVDQYYYETVSFFDLYENKLSFIQKYPNKSLMNDLEKDYNNIVDTFHIVQVFVDFMWNESVEQQFLRQLFGNTCTFEGGYNYDLIYLRELVKDLEHNLLIWVKIFAFDENIAKYDELISTAHKIYRHNSENVRLLIELNQPNIPQYFRMFSFTPLRKEEINEFATSYSGKEYNLNESEMRIIGGKPNNLIQFIAAGSMQNYLSQEIKKYNTRFDEKEQKILTDIISPICQYKYIYKTMVFQKYVIDVIDIMSDLNQSQSCLVETMIDINFIEYKNNHWKFTDNAIGYLICDVVNELN